MKPFYSVIFLLYLVTFNTLLHAQEQDDTEISKSFKYTLTADATVNKWINDDIDDVNIIICSGNKLYVDNIVRDTLVLVTVVNQRVMRNECEPTFKLKTTYVINREVLSKIVYRNPWKFNAGILTVPVRFQMSDFKAISGGQVGAFAGGKRRIFKNDKKDDAYFIGGLHLGISAVTVNNSDSSGTSQVPSMGFGMVAGINWRRSNIMLAIGQELYNVNDKKVSKEWISLGLGFSIQNPNKE